LVCVPLPAPPNSTPSTLILAAARCWRRTQDSGRPVQAALFRTLDAYRCGMLAPAFASLLALYESCLGRQIRVGGPHPRLLSADEQQLLGLLNRAGGEAARISEFADGSGLAGAMRVAVRSTRIQLRRAPGAVGGRSRAQRRLSPGRRNLRYRPSIAATRPPSRGGTSSGPIRSGSATDRCSLNPRPSRGLETRNRNSRFCGADAIRVRDGATAPHAARRSASRSYWRT